LEPLRAWNLRPAHLDLNLDSEPTMCQDHNGSGRRQQVHRPQRKQCRLSGTTGLVCARMGKTEPPTRPGPEALDIGSNHKADAFPLTPWYAGWGPPQWLGNAGDASVSRGIHLIRTSAMYPQGFHQKYILCGPISTHRRRAEVYLVNSTESPLLAPSIVHV
jgi:hypothetical protein